jgi:hypothetical protein
MSKSSADLVCLQFAVFALRGVSLGLNCGLSKQWLARQAADPPSGDHVFNSPLEPSGARHNALPTANGAPAPNTAEKLSRGPVRIRNETRQPQFLLIEAGSHALTASCSLARRVASHGLQTSPWVFPLEPKWPCVRVCVCVVVCVRVCVCVCVCAVAPPPPPYTHTQK